MKRVWPIVLIVLLVAAGAGVYWKFARTPAPAPSPPATGNATVVADTTPAASAPTPAPQAEQPQPSPPVEEPAAPASSPAAEQPEPVPPPEPEAPPVQPVAQCVGSPTVPATQFVADSTDATYCDTGHLVPGSGHGEADAVDWAPGMHFPLDRAPAYANSQVWGVGGMSGPPGGQGDKRNYSYPWHDNFCEARSYATVMCPSGKGHQGQDIRPAECCDAQGHLLQDTFVVDAVEDGRISSIGTYTVYLVGDSGRLYRYLHMDMKKLKVAVGDRVTRGQSIGYVSNFFGHSVTTFHLHFEIKAPVSRNGTTVYTWVSPYPSLVASYANLLAGHP